MMQLVYRNTYTLAIFCTQNKMELNMKMSKVIIVCTRIKLSFYYNDLQLEELKSYKYLDIHFSDNYSCAFCV